MAIGLGRRGERVAKRPTSGISSRPSGWTRSTPGVSPAGARSGHHITQTWEKLSKPSRASAQVWSSSISVTCCSQGCSTADQVRPQTTRPMGRTSSSRSSVTPLPLTRQTDLHLPLATLFDVDILGGKLPGRDRLQFNLDARSEWVNPLDKVHIHHPVVVHVQSLTDRILGDL